MMSFLRYKNASPSQRESVGIAATVGVIYALLSVGARIWTGATTSGELYLLWAFGGGVIVGATMCYLFVRRGLVAPGIITVLGLSAATWITREIYTGAPGASPNAAWTPMTIYITFWPIILGVVLTIGAVEFGMRWARQQIV